MTRIVNGAGWMDGSLNTLNRNCAAVVLPMDFPFLCELIDARILCGHGSKVQCKCNNVHKISQLIGKVTFSFQVKRGEGLEPMTRDTAKARHPIPQPKEAEAHYSVVEVEKSVV